MKPTRLFLLAALLATAVSGCIVRTARPCHTDCWWQHGHRVCAKRCH